MLLVFGLSGCWSTAYRARFSSPEETDTLDRSADFLKCHMVDGSLYVLQHWELAAGGKLVRGDGVRYDSRRRVISSGPHTVRLDRVELLETNQPERVHKTGIVVLAIAAGASLTLTAYCLGNEKACFGS